MALRTLAPLAVPGLVLLGMLAAHRSGADVYEALTAGARKKARVLLLLYGSLATWRLLAKKGTEGIKSYVPQTT